MVETRRNVSHRLLWIPASLALLPGCSSDAVPDAVSVAPAVTSDAATVGPGQTDPIAAIKALDEPILREYEALAHREPPPAELDRFIAEHREILYIDVEPYGSAMTWMLIRREEEACLALLRAGAEVEGRGKDESGPLASAAAHGFESVVEDLLARGANPRATSQWGTPLHSAAAGGHAVVVKMLIDAGADKNARSEDHQYTPLHLAVMDRHVDTVRVLLAAKVELNPVDDEGQTPLHWGGHAYNRQPVHIYRDISKPHDTVFVDPGKALVIELLLNAGAKIEATDAAGNTPLHEAARLRSVRAAEVLIARGAKRDAVNHAGETPRSIAAETKDAEMIDLLR